MVIRSSRLFISILVFELVLYGFSSRDHKNSIINVVNVNGGLCFPSLYQYYKKSQTPNLPGLQFALEDADHSHDLE